MPFLTDASSEDELREDVDVSSAGCDVCIYAASALLIKSSLVFFLLEQLEKCEQNEII